MKRKQISASFRRQLYCTLLAEPTKADEKKDEAE